jgi:hypothetical protein
LSNISLQHIKKKIDNYYNQGKLGKLTNFSNTLFIYLVKESYEKPVALTAELVQKVLFDNFCIPTESVSFKITEKKIYTFGKEAIIFNCFIKIKLN